MHLQTIDDPRHRRGDVQPVQLVPQRPALFGQLQLLVLGQPVGQDAQQRHQRRGQAQGGQRLGDIARRPGQIEIGDPVGPLRAGQRLRQLDQAVARLEREVQEFASQGGSHGG